MIDSVSGSDDRERRIYGPSISPTRIDVPHFGQASRLLGHGRAADNGSTAARTRRSVPVRTSLGDSTGTATSENGLDLAQAFDSLAGMARRHEREVADARSAYLGAVRRFYAAMRAFDAAGVPLDPGPATHVRPWTRDHVAVMIAGARAWREVVDTRRSYDAIRREFQPPH
jgi:hypothetical protein